MGTAPGQQHRIPMPDPAQQVERALALARSRRMSPVAMLRKVIRTSGEIHLMLESIGITDTAWVDAINGIATDRLAVLSPSDTDRKDGEDANG